MIPRQTVGWGSVSLSSPSRWASKPALRSHPPRDWAGLAPQHRQSQMQLRGKRQELAGGCSPEHGHSQAGADGLDLPGEQDWYPAEHMGGSVARETALNSHPGLASTYSPWPFSPRRRLWPWVPSQSACSPLKFPVLFDLDS
ncbi:receptor-type tyrosine-protein phosphatase kappa [Platysternon megacephalum]|uniref:Receptor-type tyrosine-protein phosphatase kappa n=1 Tax=Platysternon megacephalum TaxID=55544 RepID=A0A4D9E393_9SAUR|nr:receptor-type tyrosine-protein phosphatase kappa [Platysternon megacephalum]